MILLTVGQVSERLHIHPNTLRRWANQGKIPVWRFSSRGDRRFSEKDIDSYLLRGNMPETIDVHSVPALNNHLQNY